MKLKGKPEQQSILNVRQRILEISEIAMTAVNDLITVAEDAANKEHDFEFKKSEAIKEHAVGAKNAETREALAFPFYADEHKAHLVAKAKKEAAFSSLQGIRQVLSSLQTLLNASRVTEEIERYHDNTP